MINWLENLNEHKSSETYINGFTWDFTSLYDNLTPDLVLEATSCAISELRPDWTQTFTKWLISLLKLSLESNYAKHGNNWFQSKIGIPTGGSLSVSLANITIYYILRKIIYSNPPEHLLCMKRFVDDVGGLWIGSKEDFEIFSDIVNVQLNKYGLSIKDSSDSVWDFHLPDTYTVFLDVQFRFDRLLGLMTDVNIKKTDSRMYLHFDSFHPRQTFPSNVFSQALRYHRIINDPTRLCKRLNELFTWFLKSGYPKKMVQKVMEDVKKRPRPLGPRETAREPPFPVLWLQTYGPATPSLQKTVKTINKAVQKSPAWKDVKKTVGIVNKRAKNLGDLILRKKKFALEADDVTCSGTVPCTSTPNQESKRKRGRPCESCGLMSKKKSVTSSVTKNHLEHPMQIANQNIVCTVLNV